MNFEGIIALYMQGEIDINTLYSLIKQKFKEILTEDKFKELEYLRIYPFISKLQDEDLYIEEILKKEIPSIQDILGGMKNYSYNMWMKIESVDIEDYYRIWSKYRKGKGILLADLEKVNQEVENVTLKCKTIADVCMAKLLRLIQALPEIAGNEAEYNLLYTEEPALYYIEDEIEKLMEILSGKRPINILLMYTNQFSCIYL